MKKEDAAIFIAHVRKYPSIIEITTTDKKRCFAASEATLLHELNGKHDLWIITYGAMIPLETIKTIIRLPPADVAERLNRRVPKKRRCLS